MTPDEARQCLERLETEARTLGRPEIAFRDLLHRARVRHHQALVEAWEAAQPFDAKRWRDILTAMGAAKQVIERHERVAAEAEFAARRLVDMGVGERHVAALRRLDESVPLRVAREWHSSTSWCLVLLGGNGGGKTVAAAWLAREALVDGKRVRWVRAQQQAREPLFGEAPSHYADVCRTADLLVLDDLGAEQATDLWRSWLGDVVDARYASNRRTVVSSNLSLDDLKAHLGARLVDRLAEGAQVAGCGMVSRRRLKLGNPDTEVTQP